MATDKIVYVEVPRGDPRLKDQGKGGPLSPGQLASAAVGIGLVVLLAAHTGHGFSPDPATHTARGRAPAAVAEMVVPGPVAAGHQAGQPWSVFTQGGGPRAAVTWAKDLLRLAGLPLSAANIHFVYDWQVNEGGGGLYNPLNQGPVPGRPDLTSTGQQYGGGAADYKSWNAGLEGASLYLHMPNYAGVLAGLARSDYHAAAVALWDSEWAHSHYGYGASWRVTPAPGT